jgi:hypothetical protein
MSVEGPAPRADLIKAGREPAPLAVLRRNGSDACML